SLKEIFLKNQGEIPIYLHIMTTNHGEVMTSVSPRLNITLTTQMIKEIETLFGEDMVWIEKKRESLGNRL
ncbi:hypothetical protein KKD87_06240, partial [bacterium]|nr:hypothetical protein [bacterium]